MGLVLPPMGAGVAPCATHCTPRVLVAAWGMGQEAWFWEGVCLCSIGGGGSDMSRYGSLVTQAHVMFADVAAVTGVL